MPIERGILKRIKGLWAVRSEEFFGNLWNYLKLRKDIHSIGGGNDYGWCQGALLPVAELHNNFQHLGIQAHGGGKTILGGIAKIPKMFLLLHSRDRIPHFVFLTDALWHPFYSSDLVLILITFPTH